MSFFIKNQGKEMCFLFLIPFRENKLKKLFYLFIDKSIRDRGVGNIFFTTIFFQRLGQGSVGPNSVMKPQTA